MDHYINSAGNQVGCHRNHLQAELCSNSKISTKHELRGEGKDTVIRTEHKRNQHMESLHGKEKMRLKQFKSFKSVITMSHSKMVAL